MNRLRVTATRLPADLAVPARLALLISLALVIPSIGLDQRVTGPLVNALLIISVPVVGVAGAIMVGVIPSMVALLRGVLPLPMAAMVPYIVLGNAALVLTFAALRTRGYWPAVVAGAVVKFSLLYLAVTYLVMVPPAMAIIMQWPQLYTALLGGVIAWALMGLYGLRRGER